MSDDGDYDAFAHHAPFRPRRNPARQWTMMAIAAGIAMLVGVGILLYSDAPGIASRLGFALTPAETPLTLVANKLDRRDLLSGSQLFAVSGKVVNPTDTRQSVPDIRAELRDAQGRLVYSWTIRPEATTLPPRGTVEFNSAKLDVPVNSKKLALSFADEAPR
ncbi:FxLYD domain-containing protein [Sphingomonas alpina]|uniref:FxLYD domain-containing protein n=1 Tax=Sphingomonas alpina TaxID=653931 RepID=UPI001E4AFA91|nr:FxLYD domain-containing protein [Sphingomonas alpina]